MSKSNASVKRARTMSHSSIIENPNPVQLTITNWFPVIPQGTDKPGNTQRGG